MAEKQEKKSSGLFSRRKKAAASANTTARQRDFALLVRPVVTEKTSLMGSESKTVVFRVTRQASKDEIREAIERIYSVKVEAIRTCNYIGKAKRVRNSLGRRAAFKKAYISLKEGQRIDVVEGL